MITYDDWVRLRPYSMYEAILLPTDGSDGMASAIRHCFHQAQQHEAVVHALYVVDLRAYVMLPDETQQRVKELLVEEGDRALAALTTYAEDEGIELVTAVVEGTPHDAILRYTEEQNMDLIVMGTHGRSGEEKRIVGSVAEEVVRNATIPVLTMRATQADIKAIRTVLSGETPSEVPDDQRRYIS